MDMSVFIRLKEWKPACVFAQHTIINKFSFELSEGRCVSLLLHLQGCIQTLTALMLYKSCYFVHLFLELPDERKPYVFCYTDVVCIFVMYCTCMYVLFPLLPRVDKRPGLSHYGYFNPGLPQQIGIPQGICYPCS